MAGTKFLAAALAVGSLFVMASSEPVSSAPRASAVVEAGVAYELPESYVSGGRFPVTVRIETSGGVELPLWQLGPGAFTLDRKPLIKRGSGKLPLPPGASLELSFDLGPALAEAGIEGDFELGCEGSEARPVAFYAPAPQGLAFMDPTAIPDEALADYKVLLSTTAGDLLLEFYPHLAPGHVRNYLDLSNTGFYDGVLFHRVIPGFMIQGGDPLTKDPSKSRLWGTGNGPRSLDAEFTTEKHVRGILSAARSQDPNSASCQFFIMHATYPTLDGSYSVFGKLVSGYDALDAIATAPRGAGDRPDEEQKILSATVLYDPQ